MDSDAVFVGLAGLQINWVAAYPAEIRVLEMGLARYALAPTRRADCKRDSKRPHREDEQGCLRPTTR